MSRHTIRYSFLLILSCMSMVVSSASSCDKNNGITKKESNTSMANSKIKIKAGSKTFAATLYANEASKVFKAMLPLTLDMKDYNGNEKKYDFSKAFPTDNHNPKQINTGDLMIWSGNTLVLFYKSFPTSYSYTMLGKVDDVIGLAEVLGTGNVTVTFENE